MECKIWKLSRIPCEENGFKGFDYEKLCAMVLFFAHKNTELLKTKLMKLLNYSDMIFYKENGISVSGLKYAHLPYGPECDFSEDMFTKEERKVLERIYLKFKDFGSRDISDYSHREKGYSSTKQGEIISYSYAKDIQFD